MIGWLDKKFPHANIYGLVFMGAVVGIVTLLAYALTQVDKW